MPVPETYSRRYGSYREESSYPSYSSRSTGRSYLSSYSSSKLNSSLPPRAPSLYEHRKLTESSSTTTSRFLSSSASRARDYGTSYRSSVSPVRATSSYRRTLDSSSISDRLKAIDMGDKDLVSKYSTRPRDSSLSSTKSSYLSSYSRERSASREIGGSPVSSSPAPAATRDRADSLKSSEAIRSRSSSSGSNAALSRAGGRNGVSRLTSEDSDAYSSSPHTGRFRSKEVNERAGLTGLRNIGNTCFMNSVLQCLSNTRPLLEYVQKDNYTSEINSTTSGMKGALIRAFGELIQELWRESRVVDTSAFKDQIQRFAPRFMGYSQQDAQEFLRYLLEGLHEDVNRVTAKPKPILTDIDDDFSDSQKAAEAWKRYLRYDDSRIVDIFVGQLKSTLKCTTCGHCSVTFDPFWDLSMSIPSKSSQVRLSQCFELFTREEVLDGDEKPTCAKCQCRRKCTKSLSIQKFPKILVIHLKRFSPMERYRGKLSTTVDFPLNGLDLSQFAANRGQGCSYNLYGIANHSGSTYSGHYIAYCKHPYNGEWNCYNDSRVSPVSSHSVVSSEGYVLFYEHAGQSSQL